MAGPSSSSSITVLQSLQEDFLTCQICHDLYRQPKALPCWGLHTFCQECLRDYIMTRHFETVGRFPCPLCRRQISIPPEGVAEFPNNVFIQGLLDKFTDIPEQPVPEPTSVPANGSVSPRRLYPVLPQDVDQSVSPSREPNNGPTDGAHSGTTQSRTPDRPTGGSTRRPHRPKRPRLIVKNMESLRLPITRGRHGARLCFGKFGTGVIDFTKAIGLAVSQNGAYIIVSDQQDNRIMIFESTGQIKSLFTLSGLVYDITMNKYDQLLVANAEEGPALVCAYNLNGEKVGAYGNFFSHESPHGVGAFHNGNMMVSSADTNCVYTLGETGKLLHTFGGKGNHKCRFKQPHHLATNNKDCVAVSDCGNDCVKVLDRAGNFQAKMGAHGGVPGKLDQPRGLCFDKFNNILVADSENSRVQLFTRDGKFHHVLFHTRHDSIIVKPINVAVMPGGEVAVLVVGHQFAEVRVYRYEPSRYKHNSQNCVCL